VAPRVDFEPNELPAKKHFYIAIEATAIPTITNPIGLDHSNTGTAGAFIRPKGASRTNIPLVSMIVSALPRRVQAKWSARNSGEYH